MSLMYTEEEQAFRAEVHDLCKRELEPIVTKIENEEISPVEFIRKLGRLAPLKRSSELG